MKPKKEIPVKWIAFLLALCTVLSILCYFGRGYLADSAPFAASYVFDGPSGVFAGAEGRVYIVDNGKKSVIMTNGAREITRVIEGGKDSDQAFYYASQVAEGPDGSVYIADARYAHQGTMLKEERIFRYDANGRNPQLVYKIGYEGVKNPPMQYGNIKSMFMRGTELIFSVKTAEGIDVCTLNTQTGEVGTTSYALPGVYLSDAAVDPLTLRPVFTDFLGEVCTVNEAGAMEVLVKDGSLSWNLCTDGAAVYYTDLSTKCLIRLDMQTREKADVIEGESILFTARMGEGRVFTTDYIGYYEYDGREAAYVDALSYSQPALRAALWVALCLDAVLVLALLYIVLLRPWVGKKRSITFQRTVIVLSVSICMSVMVTYITLGRMVHLQNNSIMEQLSLYDDVMIKAADVEALRHITNVEDYQGEAYERVKQPLDRLMDMTYDNQLYYYYIIYVADGSTIYAVMDYESTLAARHPMYDWGEEGYTDVLQKGETVSLSADVSSYGSWSFVLKPILDEFGQPVAIMEVGTNLDDLNTQTNSLIREVVLTVVSMSVVLLMLILEVLFYVEHREKRLEVELLAKPGGIYLRFPLRTLAFITFLADCMQDPFVSILANKLYVPIWGIPQSLGAALPLSGQVLGAALAAFICGHLVRRMGIKRLLSIGYLLQIAGFVICGVTMNYSGLLGGKVMIGIGMGAIIVGMNSISALGESEEANSEAFAAINAGTLAGVTVGAGIGSIILTFSGFYAIYFAGAFILLLGFLIAFTGADHRETAADTERPHTNILQFLKGKEVWSFLLLVLTPFLIAISFRDYFFPIFAAEQGINETDIGRIFLVCGLFVIYVGPQLTRSFISRLGGKWTVALAGACITAATLLFGLYPSLGSALVGMLLLSLAISFGYAAQSTYYAGLPQVSAYGESRAMGAYSLFDNGGQTLGPILYGAALLLGYQRGVLVIGAALLCLLVLFITVNSAGRRNMHKESEKDLRREISEKGEL